MQTLETIRRLYDYNIWANAEILRYLQNAERRDEKAVRVFAHLLLAEKTWLERIANNSKTSLTKVFNFKMTVAARVQWMNQSLIAVSRFVKFRDVD